MPLQLPLHWPVKQTHLGGARRRGACQTAQMRGLWCLRLLKHHLAEEGARPPPPRPRLLVGQLQPPLHLPVFNRTLRARRRCAPTAKERSRSLRPGRPPRPHRPREQGGHPPPPRPRLLVLGQLQPLLHWPVSAVVAVLSSAVAVLLLAFAAVAEAFLSHRAPPPCPCLFRLPCPSRVAAVAAALPS